MSIFLHFLLQPQFLPDILDLSLGNGVIGLIKPGRLRDHGHESRTKGKKKGKKEIAS